MISDTKLQSIVEYIKIHNSNTEAQLQLCATKSLSGLLLLKFEPIPLKSQSTLEFEAFNCVIISKLTTN